MLKIFHFSQLRPCLEDSVPAASNADLVTKRDLRDNPGLSASA